MNQRPPHPPQRVLLIAAYGQAIEDTVGGCALFHGSAELMAAISPAAERLTGRLDAEALRRRRQAIMAAVAPILDPRYRGLTLLALRRGDVTFLEALVEARLLSFTVLGKVAVSEELD